MEEQHKELGMLKTKMRKWRYQYPDDPESIAWKAAEKITKKVDQELAKERLTALYAKKHLRTTTVHTTTHSKEEKWRINQVFQLPRHMSSAPFKPWWRGHVGETSSLGENWMA